MRQGRTLAVAVWGKSQQQVLVTRPRAVRKRSTKADELAKLPRLLGLVGSHHRGERATVAWMTDQFVRTRRWAWTELLLLALPTPEPQPQLDWRFMRAECDRHRAKLTDRERRFIYPIAYCRSLSDRQLGILRRIFNEKACP
jgi:hypothetical protein